MRKNIFSQYVMYIPITGETLCLDFFKWINALYGKYQRGKPKKRLAPYIWKYEYLIIDLTPFVDNDIYCSPFPISFRFHDIMPRYK